MSWLINPTFLPATLSKPLAKMTALIYILSVVDGALTIFWVLSNLAEEANPLMDYLIRQAPVLFMLVKTTLVALGVTLLWRFRARTLALGGIVACFFIYAAIVAYHLNAIQHFFLM